MDTTTRRSVLKTIAGSGVIAGSLGAVSARPANTKNQEQKTTKFIYRAKTHLFPKGVTCDDTTQSNDFGLIGGGVSWPGDTVGYQIAAESARSAGISPDEFQAAGDAAAAAWDQYADRINLQSGNDITIEFGSLDGPGSVVGVAFVVWNPTTDEIVNVDIALDAANDWKVFPRASCPTESHEPTVLDVQNVLTHEFGHALGLGHESGEDTDVLLTMYPFTTFRETHRRSPENGDIGGINELYG